MDLLLDNLLKSFSTSGNEDGVKEVIKNELNNLSIDYKEDKMGNLIIRFKVKNLLDSVKINNTDDIEKLMICTHMDSIGFITTFIEDNGCIRVAPIGNFDITKVLNSILMFKKGTVGKLVSLKDNPSFNDLYVDIGANSKEEAEKLVKEGESAVIKPGFIEKDDCIMSPGLNNKIGCYVLLKAIEKLKNIDLHKEIYCVFSTQNILGGRGARAAANLISPDYAIVIDMEEAKDTLGKSNKIEVGQGPTIKVMDKSLIIHHEIKELLEKGFDKVSLKPQYVVSEGCSDGGLIHKEGSGVKTGELGIPCRYINSNYEVVSKKDVENFIKVLEATISLI